MQSFHPGFCAQNVPRIWNAGDCRLCDRALHLVLSVIAADGHIALLAAQSHVIALACDLDQVGYFAQRVLLELGQLLVQTNQFARHRAQLVEVLRATSLDVVQHHRHQPALQCSR